MRAGFGPLADWKDAEAYAPLLRAARSGFAWEWLRRNDSYRAAALRSGRPQDPGDRIRAADTAAERWGLHAFEAPDRCALAARPVWRRSMFRHVLEAEAVDGGPQGERLDLKALEPLVTLVTDPLGTEHLLLSDGLRGIRIDILSGTLRSGAALLRYRLAGFAVAEPLLVLRQLVALSRNGRFSAVLHPPEQRARRRILLLRVHDALTVGASQRDIAEQLLGLRQADRWRVQASSLRSRAQRLVRDARRMAAGGYATLLR